MALYTLEESKLIKDFIIKLDIQHPNWSCNQMLSQLSDWTDHPSPKCCDNEQRSINGGCINCGDPSF